MICEICLLALCACVLGAFIALGVEDHRHRHTPRAYDES